MSKANFSLRGPRLLCQLPLSPSQINHILTWDEEDVASKANGGQRHQERQDLQAQIADPQ